MEYPIGKIIEKQEQNDNDGIKGGAPQIFGNAGLEYIRNNRECKQEHLDKIAYKNHLHSSNNPYSQNRRIYSIDEIRKSGKVYGPMTKLHCCTTSDGAAAVILCSEDFMIKNNLMD